MHYWKLRPTGVSSFNQFIHELSVDSDMGSSVDNSSGEDYSDDGATPLTPRSESSQASSELSFSKHDMCQAKLALCFRYILAWILFPAKFLAGILTYFYIANTTLGNLQHLYSESKTKMLKDHSVQHAIDRRRGVIEDVHLLTEIFIEVVFDFIHKAACYFLSPLETSEMLISWFSSSSIKHIPDDASEVLVQTATLADTDPALKERTVVPLYSLNTDGRTCREVITELGYPYEAISVVTSDGYVLLLERIPRRDSQKVVYPQHGLFDSSIGWISNGVVGSPAFAAFDQGYDVFLGNLRGLVSREHINKYISSRKYWRYSMNEYGVEDIPAMIEKIHEVKTTELKYCELKAEEEQTSGDQPYKMCAICHSLGGAAGLMYAVVRRIEEKPHRLSRLILLSPAGFHDDSILTFKILGNIFRWSAPVLEPLVPGLYIPSWFLRMLLNKFARDLHNYPAVGGLVQTLMSFVAGGDSSNWVGILSLPHYNMYDMPGVSFNVALHLAQTLHSKKFQMFDYGSAAANMEVYGSSEPLDLAEYYELIDIPVDLVAGRKDQVIRSSMIKKHYTRMKNAGVNVSFQEFEYGHLDFTKAHSDEILAYVISRLLLVAPRPGQKALRSKKRKR
ncbi:hypothetical protein DCAR_0313052 [Daucus carota subsp. sativus]|uniref:Partial AB-hydrolase lipase domain-containing protein n=1 Tax=Daucus carota subsp. sativus TaxID=79200 RepID=A0AAF1AVI4_DAUCS|nr:hypothetical protein DCAR_0313052 [Daucus carota subsp. sativus]